MTSDLASRAAGGGPGIPKRLGHIWIGPKPAPTRWMETWPRLHPGWSYTVYDNDTLVGFPFRLRRLINEYAWRGAWAGAQDMMRYELLFRFGGFMADADAISLHPVDELLDRPRAYTVYDRPETDRFRGVCPILACEPGNPFLGAVIDELARREPWELGKPEASTGNRFLMRMIRKLAPGPETLQIFPTHYFVPWQKSAPDVWYDGPDKVYAEQKWGTSMWSYNREGGPSDEVFPPAELQARRAALIGRLAGAFGDRQDSADRARAAAGRRGQVQALAEAARPLLALPGPRQDMADLGRALGEGMAAKGLPARFQGLHFYRHMQDNPLEGSKLRSRSGALRTRLLGWLGSARHALVCGYDTGHLLLAALQLNPSLRLAAVDAGRWPLDKDRDPPARGHYVPLARDWLAARFPDRLTIAAGDEAAFLAGPAAEAAPGCGYDLVCLPDADLAAWPFLTAARGLLHRDTLVVSAAARGDGGQDLVDRLRVQGLVEGGIVERSVFDGAGSLSVFWLDGARD